MEKLMNDIFEKTGNIEAYLYLKQKAKLNTEVADQLIEVADKKIEEK